MFDPNQFMSSAVDPMNTQMEVVPEGDYRFLIDGDPKQLTPKNLKGISQRTNEPYDFWQIELLCFCLDDAVKQKLGRDKVTVRLRLNLDLDATGRLEVGANKNIGLGQLRDALGQNKPGWSPQMLLGAGPFIGKVKHNTTDKGTFADIQRVARIS